jgi:hypothetical protein
MRSDMTVNAEACRSQTDRCLTLRGSFNFSRIANDVHGAIHVECLVALAWQVLSWVLVFSVR